jgi:membrane-associated protease RseP (regulator of RpoE activity)
LRRAPGLPTHPLFHLFLLLATLTTTTFFGGTLVAGDAPGWRSGSYWRAGLTFSVPLLLILGLHELAHTIACRRYGLPATLPYFLPAPVGFGTFGALIRIRAPIESRRALFDVGASGPLAGFATTLAVVAWAATRSSFPSVVRGMWMGRPLLLWWAPASPPAAAEISRCGPWLAGWFGLFVTAMNLLPLAQLDGGHVLYAVAGRVQRPIAWILFAALVGLAWFWLGWIVWAVLVLMMGVAHPPTAQESPPLGKGRKAVAVLCLAVFVACFLPVPIRIAEGPSYSAPSRRASATGSGGAASEGAGSAAERAKPAMRAAAAATKSAASTAPLPLARPAA